MCALVTGVQTCALPICRGFERADIARLKRRKLGSQRIVQVSQGLLIGGCAHSALSPFSVQPRSEERRVGTECVSPCRSRWSQCHLKKKSTLKILPQTNNKNARNDNKK